MKNRYRRYRNFITRVYSIHSVDFIGTVYIIHSVDFIGKVYLINYSSKFLLNGRKNTSIERSH
ncbi:hypothetical protein Anas_12500 [Armadillidium nasatum]|uniref:Uncharacterized protein n=1 Tax=Armadillidium nasatum TaxID=96803 RepID=A0A5N5TFW2_9CRUS|nr:hypothetical protein Anas_12500 [Armadillidium nasatum]